MERKDIHAVYVIAASRWPRTFDFLGALQHMGQRLHSGSIDARENNPRYLQLTTDNLKFVFRGNLPERKLEYAIVKRNRSVTEPLFGSFHSRQLLSLAGFLV